MPDSPVVASFVDEVRNKYPEVEGITDRYVGAARALDIPAVTQDDRKWGTILLSYLYGAEFELRSIEAKRFYLGFLPAVLGIAVFSVLTLTMQERSLVPLIASGLVMATLHVPVYWWARRAYDRWSRELISESDFIARFFPSLEEFNRVAGMLDRLGVLQGHPDPRVLAFIRIRLVPPPNLQPGAH